MLGGAVGLTFRERTAFRARVARMPSQRRKRKWQELREWQRNGGQREAENKAWLSVPRFLAARAAGTMAPEPIPLAVSAAALRELVGWMALAVAWGAPGVVGRLEDWAELLTCSKRTVQRALARAAELGLVVVRYRFRRAAARHEQRPNLYEAGPALKAVCPPVRSGSSHQSLSRSSRVDTPGARLSTGELRRKLVAELDAVARRAPEGVDRRAQGAGGPPASPPEARHYVRALAEALFPGVTASWPAVEADPPAVTPPGKEVRRVAG